MMKMDVYEAEILSACEQGRLKSVASSSELSELRAAAHATGIKDRRVNTHQSPPAARRRKGAAPAPKDAV